MRLLGKAGDELVDLLTALANGGFDRAAEKAKALGGVLGADAAHAAGEFNDALVNLRTTLSGFTNQLAGPLQGLTNLINKVAEFLAKIPAPLKAFVVGAGLAGAAALVLAGAIGALVFALGALASVTGAGVIAALIGGITGLGAAAASSSALVKNLGSDLAALDKDDKLAALVATNPTGQKKGTITIPDPAAEKAARAAHLAQIKQAAQDELAATRAGLAGTEEIENERFARRLTSLSEFFRARTNIVEQGIAAELKAQNQQLTQLKAAPLAENTEAARIQRETEIQSLEQSIARTKVEGETRLLSLVEQERVARKSAATEFTSFIAQIATAQGQTLQAAQLEIEQSADRFREVLSNLGVDNTQSEALVGRLTTLITNRAAVTDQQAKAERELNALARERETIEQAVTDGTVSERDGVLAIAESERRHKVTLQETVTLMRQFAEETKDPALLDAADQLQQHISSLGHVTLESTRLIAHLKDSLLDAAESDLSGFLGSAINEVTSLGDAFRQLAATVIGSFQRIAAQILSAEIIEKIGGLSGRGAVDTGAAKVATAAAALGASATATSAAGTVVSSGAVGLGGSATALATSGGILISAAAALTAAAAALAAAGSVAGIQAGLASAAGALGFASGGHVSGPGTGTSDSIPARLSAGEFVQPARTVEHYGVRFMESLRRREISRDVLFGREQRSDLRGDRTNLVVARPLLLPAWLAQPVVVLDHISRLVESLHVRTREFVRVILGERGIREGGDRREIAGIDRRAPGLDKQDARLDTVGKAALSKPAAIGAQSAPLLIGERGRESTISDVRHESRSLVSRVVGSIRETLFGRQERSEKIGVRLDSLVERMRVLPLLATERHVGRDVRGGETGASHVIHNTSRNLVQHVRERTETLRVVTAPDSIERVIEGREHSSNVSEHHSVSRDDHRSSSLVAHVVRSVVETVHRLTSLRREERSELAGEHHARSTVHARDEVLKSSHILARDLSRVGVGERGVRERDRSEGSVGVTFVGDVGRGNASDLGREGRLQTVRSDVLPHSGGHGGSDSVRVSHATLALGVLHDSANQVLETVRSSVTDHRSDTASSRVERFVQRIRETLFSSSASSRFSLRDRVERDTLLRREKQSESPASAAKLDKLGAGAGGSVRRISRIEEHLLSTFHRTHDAGRDLVQQFRERSESVQLTRQQHHFTDGSSTRNDTAQERRVSREDRKFLFSASHEHRSLVSRVLETIRETLFRREQVAERRESTLSRRDTNKVSIAKVSDVDLQRRESVHVLSRDLLQHVRKSTESRDSSVNTLSITQAASLVGQHRPKTVEHFGHVLHHRSVSRDERSSSVSHETRSLEVVQYTIRRVFGTLARDVLEFARVMALATSVAHSSTSSSVQAFASGGYVRGPGTATSDSIPARLSNREFVQPARATAYYGVSVMEAIRTLRIPRELLLEFTAGLHTPRVTSIDSIGVPQFAEGGLVTVEQQAAAAAQQQPARADRLHITVEHSEDTIVRVLQSSAGVKAQVTNVRKNKGMFRAAGGG
jgi:hypothetical protein